jgi:carbon-monoxide dehydrogenase medium subunit
MKPAPFDYEAPSSIAEVLDLLQPAPDETSLLAGGQSLVPLLNMRWAQPRLLIDLNRVEGLDGIEGSQNGRVRIGSMLRQRRLETEPLVRERLPLLSEAATHIAHVPIRTRGTVGGSVAHADPAAELPAAISALDGRVLLRGPAGERTLPAADFFVGSLTTAIEPGELLTGVEVEALPPGTGWAFVELARTHGAFAIAGAAAVVGVDQDGRIDRARLALSGVGGAPFVLGWLEEAISGESPGEALFHDVGDRVRGEVQPFDDIHASAEYRSRLAGVLAARALQTASVRANGAAAR